jgi:peptidoglycan/LPS O-acetylase OafA/YrhL
MEGARLRHVPALDGLRGVAVAAVIAFHAHVITGGWLGVDIFFVLSGYLITRLLLVEHRNSGRIALGAFWTRRAKRLLPALALLVVIGAAVERHRGRLSGPTGARWDVLGALTYSSNWLRLRGGAGYWSRFGPPSLFEHLWSLAIEEQFYVVSPIVMMVLLRLRRSLLVVTLTAMTALAGAWSVVAFANSHDASRVYMGTDTRAVALIVGALVGVVANEWPHLVANRVVRYAGSIGFVMLLWPLVMLNGRALVTYHGGLVACSGLAALVVAAVGADRGPLVRVLATRPMGWLGTRSYGLYLWHWPIFVGLGIVQRASPEWWRIAAGVVMTAVASETSYRLVEMPIRRKGLAVLPWRAALPAVAGLAIAAAAIAVLAPVSNRLVSATDALAKAARDASPPSTLLPTRAPTPPSSADLTAEATTTTSPPLAIAVAQPIPLDRPTRVLVVGDSVGYFLGVQLERDADLFNSEVHNAAVPACPPSYAPLQRRTRSGEVPFAFAAACSEAVRNFRTLAESVKPDVVYVVFGASLLDQNEIAPGTWSAPCEAPFDEWYSQLHASMAADLGSSGARVVLVSQAYYRSETSSRTPLLDDQIDCENRVAAEFARASNGAIGYVDLGHWTCPTRECLKSREGIELRADGTHFKDAGATLANAELFVRTFG